MKEKNKNSRRHIWLLMFSLSLLAMYACSRMDVFSEMEKQRKLAKFSVAEAQSWYQVKENPVFEFKIGANDTMSGNQAGRTKSGIRQKRGILGKPNWERARESNQGHYAIVEMPVKTNGRLLFMDNETRQWRKNNRGKKGVENSVRLVIQKDLETGKVRSFITVFVGTLGYLQGSNRMQKNGYFKREKDFEGDVKFYNLDGSLINGWRYRGGKIVARITPTQTPNNNVLTLMSEQEEECHDELQWVEPTGECERDNYVEWDEELGQDVPTIDMNCDTEGDWEWVLVCKDVDVEDPVDPQDPNEGGEPNEPHIPTDPGYVDPDPPTYPPNPGTGQTQTYKVGDKAPASTPWRDKLKTIDDFGKYLKEEMGRYMRNANGEIIYGSDGEKIPNLDYNNCHYYAFGGNSESGAYDPPWTKDVAYPDLSDYNAIGPNGTIQVGDRVCYYIWQTADQDWRTAIQHSAIVTEVDAQGFATKVQGKMGSNYEDILEHHPRDIPESYGSMYPTTNFGNGVIKYNRIYYRHK